MLYGSYTTSGLCREYKPLVTRYRGTIDDIIQSSDSTYYFSGSVSVGVWLAPTRFFLMQTEQDRRLPELPTEPILVEPEDEDSIGVEVNFEWLASIDVDPFDTVTYSLRVLHQGDTLALGDIDSTTIAINLLNYFGDSPVGEYSWNVSAHSSYPDTVIASVIRSFTFTYLNAIGERVDGSGLVATITPQPVTYLSTISIFSPSPSRATLTLYTILGQKVQEINEILLSKGTTTLTIPFSRLPSGWYIVSIRTPETTKTLPIQHIQ